MNCPLDFWHAAPAPVPVPAAGRADTGGAARGQGGAAVRPARPLHVHVRDRLPGGHPPDPALRRPPPLHLGPLYWTRPILASNTPTAGASWSSASRASSPHGRWFSSSPAPSCSAPSIARMALAMAIALVEAATHVLLGMYGPVGPIGVALIALQLFSGGAVVAFLDGLLGMGYGLRRASAFSLLAATNTSGKIIWKIADAGRGPSVTGSLVATFLVLLLAVFLHGCHVLLPMRSGDAQGRRDTLPVKLLYTSSLPIVLHSAAVPAFSVASQLLHYSRYGGGMVARLIGTWEEASYAAVPVGGLAYDVIPPAGLRHVVADPLHALSYAVLLLTSCALLSRAWATRHLALDFPDAAIVRKSAVTSPPCHDRDDERVKSSANQVVKAYFTLLRV